jgi:hypothetical protein
MRVLIFGATGAVGICLIREALSVLQSCTLVLYVRSPEKFPDDISSNPAVVIIKGQLDDLDALSKAMEGVDSVLSALGPSVKKGPFHPSGTPLAHAYSRIIDLMYKHHVRRLIALGTASITDPHDKFNLAFSILVKGVAIAASNAYKDVVAIGEAIRGQGADLGWTIVRVPILTDQESKEIIAGYVGDGKTNTWLSRPAFAAFVIGELEKGEWVKTAPIVCSL